MGNGDAHILDLLKELLGKVETGGGSGCRAVVLCIDRLIAVFIL